MVPRLVAIAGPVEGGTYGFTGSPFSIGRDTSNHLCILDGAVSRQHCQIEQKEGRLLLRDLESSNGTFVNGIPVRERLLENGDRIKIGRSLFLVVEREESAAPGATVCLKEDGCDVPVTARLNLADPAYGTIEQALERLATTDRAVSALQALLKFSAAVGTLRNLDAIQEHIVRWALETVPADRVVIAMMGKSPDDPPTLFGQSRGKSTGGPITVSRTVLNRALKERSAILSNEIPESPALRKAESLAALRIRSVLAVPFETRGRALGALYLDSSNPAVTFDQDHLQLLTAAGGIAAVALDNASRWQRLEDEKGQLLREINGAHPIIGESQPMQELLGWIAKVGPSDATALLTGESGTGKEVVARALHTSSPRSQQPFVAINCAALPETLLESELFGHEKGSFTGAVSQQKGRLELADDGTFFLDEVSELSPTAQAKLLRVLQERQFERVGGSRTLTVNIRVIAATNQDLKEAVQAGKFREDLFYRLNVVSVEIPPLRERRPDIPLLANYFLSLKSREANRQISGISTQARDRLLNYKWPGNVRELQNAIEHAVVLGSSEVIQPEDLPEILLETKAPSDAPEGTYHETVQAAKKDLIRASLLKAGGNYTKAAKALGVHPNYLHRLMRNLNLKESE